MVEAAGSLYALALLDFGSDGTGRNWGPGRGPEGRANRLAALAPASYSMQRYCQFRPPLSGVEQNGSSASARVSLVPQ